jgi:Kef-type K+ transport system membrane component KefB
MPFDSAFAEVAALLALSALVGGAALLLRQPLIVAYIAVGILAGPAWLRMVTADESVELLASMGIALLLFVVGLRLDLQVIRTMGPVALLAGVGQMALIAVAGYGLALLLGFPPVHALYIAVALAFSSTIIVIKLLSDRREIDALHGRIAVGILIVQDIAVIAVLIGLAAFSGLDEGQGVAAAALLVLAKAALALVAVTLITRYALPRFAPLVARSQELLVLSAVAWALALAAAGVALGFSKEVGAFVAGMSLASTPFRDALGARLVSLRDFLLLFFFLSLGASLDLDVVGARLDAAVVLALFVLLAKPVVVMALVGALGYRRRVGFLAGVSLAQISEFSLILGALGLRLGHLDAETVGVITMVGLITFAASSYMIQNANALYERLAPFLGPFERRHPRADDVAAAEVWGCIVFGLGRYGSALARNVEHLGVRVLGIDFDPEAVAAWEREGRAARYGDAEDPEFAGSLPLAGCPCVVSTVPDLDINLALLDALRHRGYDGIIALTARRHGDDARLEHAGAGLVLRPFQDAADEAARDLAGLVSWEAGPPEAMVVSTQTPAGSP